MIDRLPRRLLLFATALLAAGLLAMPAGVRAGEIPVRLVAPAEGTVLAAGSTATLEWAPLAGLDRQGQPEGWEEWEAFLSLDGGATYPVRITPHLDRGLHRVTWKVPSLPTANGRLLLRVGDERREAAFELPQRFAIAAAAPGMLTLDLSRTVWRRGEPARPGEPGVLAWVEGTRQGGPVREVVAAEPARALPGFSLPGGRPALIAVVSQAPPSGSPAADPEVFDTPPPSRTVAAASAGVPIPAAADLLLLLQRQNE
jgi:hypothetical protein